MVTVRRTPEQQVQQQAQPNANIGVRASAESFGAGLGRGLSDLGQSLDKISDDKERERIREMMRAEETNLNFAAAELTREENKILQGDETTEGFLTLQGKNAGEGLSSAKQRRDAARQRIRESLPNDQQKARFDLIEKRSNLGYESSLQGHTNRQTRVAEVQALDTTIQEAHQAALIGSDNPGIVTHELGKIVRAEIQSGKINGVDQDTIDLRIDQRAGALYVDVVRKIMGDDKLPLPARVQQAEQYMSDKLVLEKINPKALESLQEDYSDLKLVSDTTIKVSKTVADERTAGDFSPQALESHLEEAADQFGEDLPAFDMYRDQLTAQWRAERGRIEQKNNGLVKQFREDMPTFASRAEALQQAQQLPKEVRGAVVNQIGRTDFPGDPSAEKRSTKPSTIEQLQLEQKLSKAIRNGLITSPEEIIRKYSPLLESGQETNLFKLFQPDAEGVREKEIVEGIESSLAAIFPNDDEDDIDSRVAELKPKVRKILGGADATEIDAIVKRMVMEKDYARIVVDPDTGIRGIEVFEQGGGVGSFFGGEAAGAGAFAAGPSSSLFGSDEGVSPETFQNSLPVIPEDQKESVNEKMIAAGLDPKINSPRLFYLEEVLGQRLGETPAARARIESRAFITEARNRDLQATIDEDVSDSIRATAVDFEYPEGSGHRGMQAMRVQLNDARTNATIPDWMTQALLKQGDIEISGGKASALKAFTRKLALTPSDQRGELIYNVGTRLLRGAYN